MHRTIVFIHIPKCGGTTINRVLKLKLYSPIELLREAIAKKRDSWDTDIARRLGIEAGKTGILRSLRGRSYFKGKHFAYGADHYIDVPSDYLTMLRHPVDLVVSAYHFTKRLGEEEISIEDYVRKGRNSNRVYDVYTDNLMVRMLAGDQGVPVKVPIGQCSHAMLEKAKERLDEMMLCMILERLDESVLLLKNELEWKWLPYTKVNANATNTGKRSLNEATVSLIEDYNSLDLNLYQYANDLLDQKTKSYGSEFPRDLERYLRMNRYSGYILRPMNQSFSMLRQAQVRRRKEKT